MVGTLRQRDPPGKSSSRDVELRAFAEQVVLSPEIAEKLRPAEDLTDRDPGAALRPDPPARPANLEFAPRRTAPPMPGPEALQDPRKRGIAHHIMANHELQALEVMGWMLLAFPEAPSEFRLGIARVMADEQKHTRMHIERARKLGVEFGSLPVNCYIWRKAMALQSVLEYVACLPLVFEGGNLDHSLELAEAFDAAGDARSAQLMRIIHHDEIEHVRFGLEWLRRLKPADATDWEAFQQALHYPLRPSKSRGRVFQRQARLDAGMDADFVDRLEAATE